MVEPWSDCGARLSSDDGRLHNVEKVEKKSEQVSRRRIASSATDKENNVPKECENSGNLVKLRQYEKYSNSRKNDTSTNVEIGIRSTGAIKKRVVEQKNLFGGTNKCVVFSAENNDDANKILVDFIEDNGGAKKRVYFGEDNNRGTRQRAKVDTIENVVSTKRRFNVYEDKPLLLVSSDERATKTVDATSDVNVAITRHNIQDRRLGRLTTECSISVQHRVTPIEGICGGLVPKKVKIQHRRSLTTAGDVKPKNCPTSPLQDAILHPSPYEYHFIELELAKKKPQPKGDRRENITPQQRKIILKFLIRLNVHAFYPSFVLYQTVKIFDAVLDAKTIEVENLQLVALASMWIALKREEVAYKVPSASTMISYSSDLYEGRVDLLVKCEMEILKVLNFEIVFPDPFPPLCHFIITCARTQYLEAKQVKLAYYCGSYMIDLSLFNDDLMEKSAVLVAAAAAETALFIASSEQVVPQSPPLWCEWRTPDAARRYSTEEIEHVRSTLIQLIDDSHKRHADGNIIFKKYSRSRYGKIAHFLCSKVEQMILHADSPVEHCTYVV